MPERKMTGAEAAALRSLGRAVDARRRELALSRKEAAAATRLHPTYYNRLVRGEINPTYRTILRVAAGLHMTPERLVALAREYPRDRVDN